MPDSALSRSGKRAYAGKPTVPRALCIETQGREIMAVLVHDEISEAMRIGLYDKPAQRVEKANGAPLRRRTGR